MVVHFSKQGYAALTRSAEKSDNEQWEVVLCSQENSPIAKTEVFESTKGSVIEVNELVVELPSEGFVNAETGKDYQGEVTSKVVYLDPNDDNFSAMMPGGDLMADRTDGSETMLISYGMTNVEMTGNQGEKLQLKEGCLSKLEFPIPVGMENDIPETMPLWSFDETTGKWKEEGTATLVGDKYIGMVEHYSWVNLDHPASEGTIEINLEYEEETKAETTFALGSVLIKVGQLQVVSNENGKAVCQVPAGQGFDVVITPQAYPGLKNNLSIHVDGIASGSRQTVTLKLPKTPRVHGVIELEGGYEEQALVTLTYTTDMGTVTSKPVRLDKKGNYSIPYSASFKGEATFQVNYPKPVYTKKIKLEGKDYDNGKIHVEIEEKQSDNTILLYTETSRILVPLQEYGSELLGRGVWIYDDRFEYMNMGSDYFDDRANEISLNIKGFSSAVFNYTAILNLETPNASAYSYELETSLTRKNNTYTVSFVGPGMYYDRVNGVSAKVEISGNKLELGLAAILKTYYDASPYSYNFPSYAPTLNRNASFVSAMVESPKLGVGGNYGYRGTQADYEQILEKIKALNFVLVSEDEYTSGDGVTEYEKYYYLGNRIIGLWYYDKQCTCGYDDCEARHTNITVALMDGVKVPLPGTRSSVEKEQLLKHIKSALLPMRKAQKGTSTRAH